MTTPKHEPNQLPEIDEPPKNGQYIEHDDGGPVTDKEAEEGAKERVAGKKDDPGPTAK